MRSDETEIHFVGKTPAEEVKTLLYEHLSFPENGKKTNSPILRERIPVTEQEVYLLADKSMQQAKIYFYMGGQPYSQKERLLYSAFNEYFSGDFSGLVMNEIREKRSMAYTAYGFFNRPVIQGRNAEFTGYVGTQPDKVADAMDVYMSLLNDMPQHGENIESIRTVLRQSMLSNKPSFRSKSQQMTQWNRMGYAIDPATLEIRQVQKLKFEDIVSFYETHVKGLPIRMLIVGDTKTMDLKRIQATYGKVKKVSRGKLFGE